MRFDDIHITAVVAGASVSSVYLGGYNAAAIKPPSQLNIISMNASRSAGRLQALFTVRLNSSAAAVAKAATDYIYAVGAVDSAGVIQQHQDTQVELRSQEYVLSQCESS